MDVEEGDSFGYTCVSVPDCDTVRNTSLGVRSRTYKQQFLDRDVRRYLYEEKLGRTFGGTDSDCFHKPRFISTEPLLFGLVECNYGNYLEPQRRSDESRRDTYSSS